MKPLAKLLISYDIGDGSSASFWCDSWLPHGPLIDFIDHDGPTKIGLPLCSKVCQAADDNTGWRLPSERTENAELRTLRITLQSTPPPHSTRPQDSYSWGAEGSKGNYFSTKKTWELLRPTPWAKAVWPKYMVSRHAFTFWTTNLDRLPTKVRLNAWGINVPNTCSLCNSHPESRDHLFLHCGFSVQVWRLVLSRLSFPNLRFVDWQEFISWMLTHTRTVFKILKRLAAQTTIYLLWKEMNSRVHKSCAQCHSSSDWSSVQTNRPYN